MNAYSMDLRKNIAEAAERGTSQGEVARFSSVRRSAPKPYVGAAREGRILSPRKPPGSRPKTDGRAGERMLEVDLEERPAATLAERCGFLGRVAGARIGEATAWRALKRVG